MQRTEFLHSMYRSSYCSSCGRIKEMYYVPWCPKCDKPEIEMKPVLNLMQAIRHVEVKNPMLNINHEPSAGREDHSRCFWLYIADVFGLNNGSILRVDFTDLYGDMLFNVERKEETNKERKAREFLELLIDEFQLEPGEEILWEVSW